MYAGAAAARPCSSCSVTGAGFQPVPGPVQFEFSSAARKAWRRNGEPGLSASQAAGSMSVILVEILVRIQRSHASAARGCNGLTIHVIGDIASGKYARNAGGRGRAVAAALDDDVTVTHLELAGENARIG